MLKVTKTEIVSLVICSALIGGCVGFRLSFLRGERHVLDQLTARPSLTETWVSAYTAGLAACRANEEK